MKEFMKLSFYPDITCFTATFFLAATVFSAQQKTVHTKFLWGAALNEHQNSGALTCKDNNWTAWEKEHGKIKHGQQSGTSCDFWNRYPDDIKLAKNLGLNSLRFSIEWSTIEPREGEWNNDAIKHYGDVIDSLIAQDMIPMVTLHHFTHPQWFEEKGAFEHEENITYFVRFCEKVFDAFHEKVLLWGTINEPNIYAFQGYMRGVFPPGYCDIALGAEVLKNLLKAHCAVYRLLKARPGGKMAQIGIVHQHLIFEPYHEGNTAETMLTSYLSHIATKPVLEFFKTGHFQMCAVPLANTFFGGLPFALFPWSTVTHDDPGASSCLDFIGVNYYSRVRISWKNPAQPAYDPHDIVTDMPYALYEQGLYNAIKEISSLNVPMYITENGIADAQDDRRAIFIERYVGAMMKAIDDGYDIRGYFYWTLMDNFEWDEGRDMKFGLYSVDEKTKERTLRSGSLALKKFCLGLA
jgi:beta-glucosidase